MTIHRRTHGGAAQARRRVLVAAALAVVALAGGCATEHGHPTPGPPSATTGPLPTSRPARRIYYAQAAAFTGPDAWQQAQRQLRRLRAKGFPATSYSSHSEFPSHTLYFFIAAASGEFPTRTQAQAQVERLHAAGFAAARVLEISLPK